MQILPYMLVFNHTIIIIELSFSMRATEKHIRPDNSHPKIKSPSMCFKQINKQIAKLNAPKEARYSSTSVVYNVVSRVFSSLQEKIQMIEKEKVLKEMINKTDRLAGYLTILRQMDVQGQQFSSKPQKQPSMITTDLLCKGEKQRQNVAVYRNLASTSNKQSGIQYNRTTSSFKQPPQRKSIFKGLVPLYLPQVQIDLKTTQLQSIYIQKVERQQILNSTKQNSLPKLLKTMKVRNPNNRQQQQYSYDYDGQKIMMPSKLTKVKSNLTKIVKAQYKITKERPDGRGWKKQQDNIRNSIFDRPPPLSTSNAEEENSQFILKRDIEVGVTWQGRLTSIQHKTEQDQCPS